MDKLVTKGKDSKPEDTLQKIKDILSKIQLETDCDLQKSEIENCYSSRVYVKGLLQKFIGTNGKGTTKEFCMASGYCELLERIQNMMFFYNIHYLDDCMNDELSHLYKQPEYSGWEEQQEDADSYLTKLLEQVVKSIDGVPEWLKKQIALEQIKSTLSPFYYKFALSPFYHVNKKQYKLMPEAMIRLFVKSNGMASGNTHEEALVQAYSEIFERFSQKEIILKKLTPPRLPEYVIERYPNIKSMIMNIEKTGPYKVFLYDCSLGRKLPVVCGVIINTQKQRFGVRFGAHPNMGIALERVITESMQGKNLEVFTKYNSTVFSDEIENNYKNLFNTMKNGMGYFPASIFFSEPSYEFKEWEWDGNGDNTQLTYQMSRMLINDGYDIYIKDASFLGFPSVTVVVPGISELFPPSMLYLKEIKLRLNVMEHMLHIDQIDRKKAEEIIRCAKVLRGSVMENRITNMYALPFMNRMHGGSNEMEFLIAVTYYYLGDLDKAYEYMRLCRKGLSEEEEDFSYVFLAEKLLLGLKNGSDRNRILAYLKAVSASEIYEKVMEDFKEPSQILAKLYPHYKNFNEVRMDEDNNCYKRLCDFYRMLFRAKASNDVSEKHLHKLFAGFDKKEE